MKETQTKKKTSWKIVFIYIFSLTFLLFYGTRYYISNSLTFTKEDWLLFMIYIITLIIVSTLVFYLIKDRNKIYCILFKIYEELLEVEDNCVNLNRETLEMVIKIFKKEK